MYKRAIFIDESIAYQLGPRIEFDGEGKFSQKSFQDAQLWWVLLFSFILFKIMFPASLILNSQKVYKNIILLYMLPEQAEYYFIIIIRIIIFFG